MMEGGVKDASGMSCSTVFGEQALRAPRLRRKGSLPSLIRLLCQVLCRAFDAVADSTACRTAQRRIGTAGNHTMTLLACVLVVVRPIVAA